MILKENIKELSSTDFLDFINRNSNCIIDFYAEWCMPCVMMSPIIDELASSTKKVKFGKINIDDVQKFAEDYGVSSIPCLIFFKNGKEADRIVGTVSEEIIENKIKENFS